MKCYSIFEMYINIIFRANTLIAYALKQNFADNDVVSVIEIHMHNLVKKNRL